MSRAGKTLTMYVGPDSVLLNLELQFAPDLPLRNAGLSLPLYADLAPGPQGWQNGRN